MRISSLYLIIFNIAQNIFQKGSSIFKLFAVLVFAIFSIFTIGEVARSGYMWSFRSNLLVGNIYGLSQYYYVSIFSSFFIPSTIATISVGAIKLLFRQITKNRAKFSRWNFSFPSCGYCFSQNITQQHKHQSKVCI